MANSEDFQDPRRKRHTGPVLPKGPSSSFNTGATAGMKAAKGQFVRDRDVKVEGTIIEKRPPIAPVGIPMLKKPEEVKINSPKPIDPDAPMKATPEMLQRKTHVASYQDLLANDKLAKPRIKAWED